MCTDADELFAEFGHVLTPSRRLFVRSGQLTTQSHRLEVVPGEMRAGGGHLPTCGSEFNGEDDDLGGVSGRLITGASALCEQSTDVVHRVVSDASTVR